MQEGVQRQQRAAFLFSTVKGITGHQESGAGVAGLQAAALLVQAAAAPPALHLRHLNPHVHGALAGHAVSIARGGPYAVPSARPAGALLVGVSSFGAQGTNAHALLSSVASAAVIGAAWQAAPAWRRARCYVAPAVQQLVTACLLSGSRRGGRASSITFESALSCARHAFLWQYSLQGRAHLPSSAVLSMAASLLPLLGAVAAGEDASSVAATGAVLDAAMVAPAPLPHAAAARVAPAVARIKLARASGAVDVTLADQKLLAAKLGSRGIVTASPSGYAAPSSTTLLRRLVSPAAAASRRRTAAAAASAVAEAGSLPSAVASGYTLHPLLLDACLGQMATLAAAAAAPLTWVRSAAALLVGSSSPAGGAIAAAYQPTDSWYTGGASLAPDGSSTAAAVVAGVVLGDQDMPPASPGPATAWQPAATEVAAAAAAERAEEEEAGGVPADHPLLQMAEEERLLHLQAQVRQGCPCMGFLLDTSTCPLPF